MANKKVLQNSSFNSFSNHIKWHSFHSSWVKAEKRKEREKQAEFGKSTLDFNLKWKAQANLFVSVEMFNYFNSSTLRSIWFFFNIFRFAYSSVLKSVLTAFNRLQLAQTSSRLLVPFRRFNPFSRYLLTSFFASFVFSVRINCPNTFTRLVCSVLSLSLAFSL